MCWYCCAKIIRLYAAAQKLDTRQHKIFGLVEFALKERTENLNKLQHVTCEYHSAASENIL
jgi:hypothetical protein